MKIRALESFSGDFSMHKGQVMECSNKAILQDLLKAKYVEEVKAEKPKKEDEELIYEIEKAQKEIKDLKKAPKNAGTGIKEPKKEDEAAIDKQDAKKDVKSNGSEPNN